MAELVRLGFTPARAGALAFIATDKELPVDTGPWFTPDRPVLVVSPEVVGLGIATRQTEVEKLLAPMERIASEPLSSCALVDVAAIETRVRKVLEQRGKFGTERAKLAG